MITSGLCGSYKMSKLLLFLSFSIMSCALISSSITPSFSFLNSKSSLSFNKVCKNYAKMLKDKKIENANKRFAYKRMLHFCLELFVLGQVEHKLFGVNKQWHFQLEHLVLELQLVDLLLQLHNVHVFLFQLMPDLVHLFL